MDETSAPHLCTPPQHIDIPELQEPGFLWTCECGVTWRLTHHSKLSMSWTEATTRPVVPDNGTFGG